MTPTDQQSLPRDLDPDSEDSPGLRFPAGRFEDRLLDVIFVLQLSITATAELTFSFWFIASPSDTGDWHLELLGFVILQMVIVYLLHQLYR